MTFKQCLGKLGEDLACQYLQKKGYQIFKRNYKKPWGEIDIITKSPEKILVFVEVKTGRSSSEITPEMEMNFKKIKRLKRTCALFAGKYKEMISKKGWRIDLVAITIGNEEYKIRHYKNIV